MPPQIGSVKEAKGYFFDRDKVIAGVESVTRRALSRAGAFIRTRAKSSIRKRKKPSAPGQPPSSHVGYLRQFMYFAYDPSTKSVVVGPAKLGGVRRQSPTAPNVLEMGGRASRDPTRREKSRGEKRKTVNVKPRPFMRPAMDAERANFPTLFRNQLRG